MGCEKETRNNKLWSEWSHGWLGRASTLPCLLFVALSHPRSTSYLLEPPRLERLGAGAGGIFGRPPTLLRVGDRGQSAAGRSSVSRSPHLARLSGRLAGPSGHTVTLQCALASCRLCQQRAGTAVWSWHTAVSGGASPSAETRLAAVLVPSRGGAHILQSH